METKRISMKNDCKPDAGVAGVGDGIGTNESAGIAADGMRSDASDGAAEPDKAGVKVFFLSLGCEKNTVNTERMVFLVKEAGYTVVNEDFLADVIVVNSCAFIDEAKKESIDAILDVAWLKEHRALKAIVVTGCLPERYREEVLRELPEVDAVLGTGSYERVTEAIEKALNGNRFFAFDDKNSCPIGGIREPIGPAYSTYIKIGEGCNNRCSYCAIPLIRGKYRSRPMEELVEEAKQLEARGAKELNLIAQDTSVYGIDLYGKYSLAKLIRRITEETGIPWIRVLYCYPDKVTDELLEEFRTNDRLLNYLDLPVQHISDRMLSAMNRHGNKALILDTIKRIRQAVPSMVLRSTAIVGFPGETKEDFEELCVFIKQVRFDKFGAFLYSREEGTPAYGFEGQISEQVKQDRYDRLMEIQMAISREKAEEKVGQLLDVLVEGYDAVSEAFFGRSAGDAPDVDGKVFFSGRKGQYHPGEILKVRITEGLDYDLVGKVLK